MLLRRVVRGRQRRRLTSLPTHRYQYYSLPRYTTSIGRSGVRTVHSVPKATPVTPPPSSSATQSHHDATTSRPPIITRRISTKDRSYATLLNEAINRESHTTIQKLLRRLIPYFAESQDFGVAFMAMISNPRKLWELTKDQEHMAPIVVAILRYMLGKEDFDTQFVTKAMTAAVQNNMHIPSSLFTSVFQRLIELNNAQHFIQLYSNYLIALSKKNTESARSIWLQAIEALSHWPHVESVHFFIYDALHRLKELKVVTWRHWCQVLNCLSRLNDSSLIAELLMILKQLDLQPPLAFFNAYCRALGAQHVNLSGEPWRRTLIASLPPGKAAQLRNIIFDELKQALSLAEVLDDECQGYVLLALANYRLFDQLLSSAKKAAKLNSYAYCALIMYLMNLDAYSPHQKLEKINEMKQQALANIPSENSSEAMLYLYETLMCAYAVVEGPINTEYLDSLVDEMKTLSLEPQNLPYAALGFELHPYALEKLIARSPMHDKMPALYVLARILEMVRSGTFSLEERNVPVIVGRIKDALNSCMQIPYFAGHVHRGVFFNIARLWGRLGNERGVRAILDVLAEDYYLSVYPGAMQEYWRCLMEAYIRAGKLGNAINTLDEMQMQACTRDISHYVTLIKACGDDESKALALYERMQKSDKLAPTGQLFAALLTVINTKNARDSVLQDAASYGLSVDSITGYKKFVKL